jgi:hypothetical protein
MNCSVDLTKARVVSQTHLLSSVLHRPAVAGLPAVASAKADNWLLATGS